MTNRILSAQQSVGRLLIPARLHWLLFLLYLAVLPVAGTIALRNIVLGVLAVQSLFFCIASYEFGARPSVKAPSWLVLWAVFLMLFPLIAQERSVAWRELGGQWLESLLAWFVAFVVLARVPPTVPTFLSVALASALYPLLYLTLFLWAWVGGFGIPAYIEDIALRELAAVLARNIGAIAWPSPSAFPWGFRGFDPLHANLGAAAAHAFIAFAAWGLACWQRGREIKVAWLVFLLALAFLTPVLANSRASILSMSALVLLAVFVAGALLWRERTGEGRGMKAMANRLAALGIPILGVLCVMGFLAYQSYEKDPRWRTMVYKATIGFWVPDAMDVVCHGISAELESDIRNRLAGMPAVQVDEILQGMGGDGGRVLVMRAGLQLVSEWPLGLDGSRQAYKRLIHAKCGKVPVLDFAHPHQGWIDLALALGWAGMFIYLGLFIHLLWVVVSALLKGEWSGWALGLLMLCAFWISRGFFDSVYREHYLQMQAALIGFFWSGLLQGSGER